MKKIGLLLIFCLGLLLSSCKKECNCHYIESYDNGHFSSEPVTYEVRGDCSDMEYMTSFEDGYVAVECD